MSSDEEVLYKGSPLYNYLCENGMSEIETVEVDKKSKLKLQHQKAPLSSMKIDAAAPQWTVNHLDSILGCGLLLDEHRHLVECFRPLQHDSTPSHFGTALLSGISWVGVVGAILLSVKNSSHRAASLGLASSGSLVATHFTRKLQKIRTKNQSLKVLQNMLRSLEDLYVQVKKLLVLVQQNELIARSFSLRCSEMLNLKKGLCQALCMSFQKLYLLNKELVLRIPLHQEMDVSELENDLLNTCSHSCDHSNFTLDALKKYYNLYLLCQSELLRNLALCYCPEMWLVDTDKSVLTFALEKCPDTTLWCKGLCESLVRDYKLYRAIGESRNRQVETRTVISPGWDYSDFYISIRSASLHLQSLLVQTQDIEDHVESRSTLGDSDRDFLEGFVPVLLDIQKGLRSTQTCFEESLIQILKLTKRTSGTQEISIPEAHTEGLQLETETKLDSVLNPPPVDEVFELTIPRESGDVPDEDYLDESDNPESQRKEKEASIKVLQELKFVLGKKAAEWKERERKAMESKGMAYSTVVEEEKSDFPRETASFPSESGISSCTNSLESLPTSSQGVWPLPRLKGNIRNHCQSANKTHGQKGVNGQEASIAQPMNLKTLHGAGLQQQDLRRAREEEWSESLQPSDAAQRSMGFSLLAEAMAKSRDIQQKPSASAVVFIDSGEEFCDSGEEFCDSGEEASGS